MAVICSYVVKEPIAVTSVESFQGCGEQFRDFGFLSLLGPANGSVGKGSDCNGERQAQIG